MKKRLAFLGLILILAAIMIAGCEDSTETGTDSGDDRSVGEKVKEAVVEKTVGKYTGFMAWKEGMWSEMEMDANGQKMTTRMEVIGVDGDTFMFQYVFQAPGENVQRTSQIWFDKDTKKVSKYVMDMDGKIICLTPGEVPEDAVPKNDEQYPEDFPGMRYGTYTTPKGKTFDVAIFDMAGTEVWVSSEVPFGMVKTVVNGKTLSRLVDYGTSGAKPRISVADAKNCQSMQDLTNQMMAQMQQQAAAGSDSEPYVPPNAGAEATYSGDAQAAPCSMCAQIPAGPAQKACLASCSG
ncbi:TPA: hypothetical protein HA265_04265 [Candidatus Woesearchaeota archaeon]|nr:hypothetical protein [Candidatus Woesearchaeota archaeon]